MGSHGGVAPLMDRVTLVVPCYRDAATISRALESVYRQTRPVDEVIVVNDCSPETDEIERVLKRFPDVRCLRHAVNLGLAATRNTGMTAATGNVVTFLDADDELHPQKIELQLQLMGENTAITCRVQRIRQNERAGEYPVYCGFGLVETSASVGRLLLTNYLTGASLMIPKELLMKVGGYDPSLRSCEDYDLWLRLIENGVTVRNLPLPLYYYHFNERSLSNDMANISYWELEVIKRYYARSQRGFLKSFQDRCIWAWWILKHLARLETAPNETLKRRTLNNIDLLAGHPLFLWGLRAVGKFHVLRPYVLMKSR